VRWDDLPPMTQDEEDWVVAAVAAAVEQLGHVDIRDDVVLGLMADAITAGREHRRQEDEAAARGRRRKTVTTN